MLQCYDSDTAVAVVLSNNVDGNNSIIRTLASKLGLDSRTDRRHVADKCDNINICRDLDW